MCTITPTYLNSPACHKAERQNQCQQMYEEQRSHFPNYIISSKKKKDISTNSQKQSYTENINRQTTAIFLTFSWALSKSLFIERSSLTILGDPGAVSPVAGIFVGESLL